MATRDDSNSANVHLEVLGQQRKVTVDIPQCEQRVSALLPAARQFSEQIVAAAVESAASEGRCVSCHAGCGACCRQLVVISLTDAEAISQLVAALPAERQAVIRHRFAAAINRLENAGLLDANEPKGDRHLIQRLPSNGEIARFRWHNAIFSCKSPAHSSKRKAAAFITTDRSSAGNTWSLHPPRTVPICSSFQLPASRCPSAWGT